MNEGGSALKYEIFTRGKPLYIKDEDEYEEAYLKALSEFFDFQYILEQNYKKAYKYITGEEHG